MTPRSELAIADALVWGLVVVFEMQSILMLIVLLALIGLKGFGLVSALTFPPQAYDATGKQTKQLWVGILAVGLLVQLAVVVISLGFLTTILNLGFTIAVFVYLADVRPALKDVMRGRPRR